jgi:hypothetical protein
VKKVSAKTSAATITWIKRRVLQGVCVVFTPLTYDEKAQCSQGLRIAVFAIYRVK